MSYFDEVYLKRMNKDGQNRQERIKTKKEHEFDRLFLKNTEYQVRLCSVNGEPRNDICSLQPNKWNESNLIGNLLMSTSAGPLQTGNILLIHQKLKDRKIEALWLVMFAEDNLTKGYQAYKCICLDEMINLTNEYGDTIQNVPAKFINASASFVKDSFYMEGMGYREPNRNRGFITADRDFLTKGTRFDYKDSTWEIYGKDNISIKGVSYVSINEKLKREEEPVSSKEILVGEDTNFFLNGG